ncbi:MAG: BON domain-containing protein [Rhodoferax sp.]|uniref:BON domain-containing protein n=1 Tax=Rhodoferax sp. TaxID=50421 RepID=UPI003264B177
MKKTPYEYFAAIALVSAMSLSIVACSKPVETAASGPAASTTVGTEIDDTVVTASVKSALLADADVKSVDVKVETRKGEVMLSGFVDSQAQIERATAITNGVAGVKSINNKMALKTADTTVGNKVDDGIVTTRVKAALLNDASIKSLDIGVVTRKGEVQLSGFVDNQGQIDKAMEVAKATEDVKAVSNEMSIKK